MMSFCMVAAQAVMVTLFMPETRDDGRLRGADTNPAVRRAMPT